MTRRRWILAIAAAALCAGGVSLWWAVMQPQDERAREVREAGRAEARELPDPGAAQDPELDEKLDAYLGAVRQAYGNEARAEIDAGQRAELSIPVPPVDALDEELPTLRLPEAAEPAQRP